MKNKGKKRVAALMLAMIFFIPNAMTTSFANEQIPIEKLYIDDVSYTKRENQVTGEPMVRPSVSVHWENPESWSEYPEGSTVHSPDFYQVYVNNITTAKKNDFKISKNTDPFNNQAFVVDDYVTLDTGSLLEIQIEPSHYETENDVTEIISPLESATYQTREYVITELGVEFVASEDSIQVIWEDLGPSEIDYRIVYALGDYTGEELGKTSLIENKDGEVTGLNNMRSDVTIIEDDDDGRRKLAYTITENIVPGQIYSVLVEPTTMYYKEKELHMNVSNPIVRLASTNAILDLFDEGEFIRLEWDIPDSFFLGGTEDSHTIQRALLYEIVNGNEKTLVEFSKEAVKEGYYKLLTPTRETTYRIDFYFDNGTSADGEVKVPSTEVTYIPSELMIIPSKPTVPLLMTREILKEWDDENDDLTLYLVPNYYYNDDVDKLLDENLTFHVKENQKDISASTINFIWGAFQRLDVISDSDYFDEVTYDYNVYYDIWITDNVADLSTAPRLYEDLQYDLTDVDNIIIEESDNKIVGFSNEISSYFSHEADDFEEGIEPNKIYNIKIQAKKKTIYGEFKSVPTIVSVYFDGDGHAYAPPTIAKPPLRVIEDEVTDTSVPIVWEERWYEIYMPISNEGDFGHEWSYAKTVWIDTDGKLYDQERAGAEEFPLYPDEDDLIDYERVAERMEKLQTHLRDDFDPSVTMIFREVDLGSNEFTNVKYKFLAIPLSDVLKEGTIKEYVKSLADQDTDQMNQGNLSIFEYIDTAEYMTGEQYYLREGLDTNKSYVFFLYPYRVLLSGEELRAHYPTPIVVATNPEEMDLEPIPKVPTLEIASRREMEIDVRWKYNSDFEYTLYYGLTEDVGQATVFQYTMPDINDSKYPEDGSYYTVTVDDLFPNTDYYFWIKAKNISNGNESNWSNGILGRTRDIGNPYPPKGVGLASVERVKQYDLTENITDEYAVIEWVLNNGDDNIEDTSKKVQLRYEYVIEIGDNAKFIAKDIVISSGGVNDVVPTNVTLLEKNLVKINELIPNRPYYIRLKTRLVVQGSENGQYIEKESVSYSNVIRLITIDTGDEYDGDIDPIFEDLPDEDYDIGYDDETDTLIYRFRSDDETEGDRDNGVDQRLISDLIKNHVYEYHIDISKYYYKNVDTRIIEIPYSVINAFNEYEIEMVVDAGNMDLRISDSTFKEEVNRQRNLFGVAPTVAINIDELNSGNLPLKTLEEPLVFENLEVVVKSEDTFKRLNYADKAIQISFDKGTKDSVVYTTDHGDKWEEEIAYVDRETKQLTVNTDNLGRIVVADFKNTETNITYKHWSDTYRDQLFNRYHILGIRDANPEENVSEKEIVQVVYGLMTGAKSYDLIQDLSDDMMANLYYGGIKSNMSANQEAVSREEAVSLFVKAYEVAKGKAIKVDQYLLGIANQNTEISGEYKEDIAKAATIGLIAEINKVRPNDSLKYSELYVLWSKY